MGKVMRRRDVLALLGGAAGVWPVAGTAQQPKMPTIGVLVVGSPGWQEFWRVFREATRELGPSVRRVAVLANAPDPFSKPFLEQIRRGGTATGTTIDPIMIQKPEELDAAFTAMEKEPPDAVIVQPSLPTKRAAELAVKH